MCAGDRGHVVRLTPTPRVGSCRCRLTHRSPESGPASAVRASAARHRCSPADRRSAADQTKASERPRSTSPVIAASFIRGAPRCRCRPGSRLVAYRRHRVGRRSRPRSLRSESSSCSSRACCSIAPSTTTTAGTGFGGSTTRPSSCASLRATRHSECWRSMAGGRNTLLLGGWLGTAAGLSMRWLLAKPPFGLMNASFLALGLGMRGYLPPDLERARTRGGGSLLVFGGLCYTVGALVVGGPMARSVAESLRLSRDLARNGHPRRDLPLSSSTPSGCCRTRQPGSVGSRYGSPIHRRRSRRSGRSCSAWLDTVLHRGRSPPPTAMTGQVGAPTTPHGSACCSMGGYAGINWPAAFGGRGATPTEHLIFLEETTRRHAPVRGYELCRALCTRGRRSSPKASDEQKAFHLPGNLCAETTSGVRGFSEPNAGSDLASLQTRAVR